MHIIQNQQKFTLMSKIIIGRAKDWVVLFAGPISKNAKLIQQRLQKLVNYERLRFVIQQGGIFRIDLFCKAGSGLDIVAKLNRLSKRYGWKARMHRPYSMRVEARESADGAKLFSNPKTRQSQPNLIVTSWNIATAVGKKEMINQMAVESNSDIICLQETLITAQRWPIRIPGYSTLESQAESTDAQGKRGLAMLVRKRFQASYVGPISPFIMVVMIKNKGEREPGINVNKECWKALLIACVYIPAVTNPCRAQANKDCYRIIQLTRDKFPDLPFIVCGDFNSKRSAVLSSWKRRINKLILLSDIRGSPITRPTGRDVDHFLIIANNDKIQSNSVSTWVDRTWTGVSDHWPVIANIHVLEIQKLIKKNIDDDEVDGWKNVKKNGNLSTGMMMRTKFMKKLRNIITTSNQWDSLLMDVTEPEISTKNKVKKFIKVSKEVLAEAEHKGGILPERKNGDDKARKCWMAPKKVKKAIMKWRNARINGKPKETCSMLLKEVKAVRKKAGNRRWIKTIEKAMNLFKNKDNFRDAWRWIKMIMSKGRGNTGSTLQPIRDPQSNELISEQVKIANAWVHFFGKLAEDETGHSQNEAFWEEQQFDMGNERGCLKPIEEINGTLSWEECIKAIKSMKNGKVPGEDGIPSEWFKICIEKEDELIQKRPIRALAREKPDIVRVMGDQVTAKLPQTSMGKVIFEIMKLMWNSPETIPKFLKRASVCPIPKKGDDLEDMNNYRGISLISVILKIICKVVIRRIIDALERENRFAKEQAGFRDKQEGIGQVVALFEVLQRRKLVGKSTYLCFVDIRKAYDTVPQEALLAKLFKTGIRGKCLRFIRYIYSGSTLGVRGCSEYYQILRGVRQGDVMSPALFDIFINDIIEYLQWPCSVPAGKCASHDGQVISDELIKVTGFLFADDLVICANNLDDLKKSIQGISEWALKNEMTFGIPKCGIMVVAGDEHLGRENHIRDEAAKVHLQGKYLPFVRKYTYLGICVRDDLDLSEELEVRFEKGRRALYSMQNFLTDKIIPIKVKALALRACVSSILLFGAEIWGMNGRACTRLQQIENIGVRWIIGSRGGSRAVCIDTALWELNIPPIEAQAAARRARLFVKSPGMRIQINKLVQYPLRVRKHTWVSGSLQWIRKYAPEVIKFERPTLEMDKIVAKRVSVIRCNQLKLRNKSKSLEFYEKYKLESTRYYLKQYIFRPDLSLGVTQLLRARIGATLTLKRLFRMNVLQGDLCKVCGVEEDIYHIVVKCERWNTQRETNLAGLIGRAWEMLKVGPNDGDAMSVVYCLMGGETSVGGCLWRYHREVKESDHYSMVLFLKAIWPCIRSEPSTVYPQNQCPMDMTKP